MWEGSNTLKLEMRFGNRAHKKDTFTMVICSENGNYNNGTFRFQMDGNAQWTTRVRYEKFSV